MLPARWQLGHHRIVAPVKKTPGCVLSKHNPGPVCHAPSCSHPTIRSVGCQWTTLLCRYIPCLCTLVLERAGWLVWTLVSQRLPIEPPDAPMRDWTRSILTLLCACRFEPYFGRRAPDHAIKPSARAYQESATLWMVLIDLIACSTE